MGDSDLVVLRELILRYEKQIEKLPKLDPEKYEVVKQTVSREDVENIFNWMFSFINDNKLREFLTSVRYEGREYIAIRLEANYLALERYSMYQNHDQINCLIMKKKRNQAKK